METDQPLLYDRSQTMSRPPCYVLDAILYVVKTGTQWRMLPGEFAPWWAAHYYFRRWREEG